MNKINTALLSFGMSGEIFHGPLLKINPQFYVHTIVERSKERSRNQFPTSTIVRDVGQVFDNPGISLVIVNTPDDSHYEYAKRALLAGKHVVVEKPFTISSAHARELIDLAKEKKRVLSVFQNRRWDNDFLTVRQVVEKKMLGRLVEFESHFDRYRNFIQKNWKDEGTAGTGTIYNLGSHLIDQALVLFGRPEKVFADIRKVRSGALTDDSYEVLLAYPGLKVILKSSYLVREPGPRFILHGTEGSFVKYGLDPQEQHLKEGRSPSSQEWGTEPMASWGKLNTSIQDNHFMGALETVPGNYPAFYENIYQAITEQSELAVKPEEAMMVIEVIEKAIESNEKGTWIAC